LLRRSVIVLEIRTYGNMNLSGSVEGSIAPCFEILQLNKIVI